MSIADLGEVQGRYKNAGNSGGVIGMAGGGHPTKLLPCPPVYCDLWNHTGGDDIANTPFRDGWQSGPSLAVHESGR